MNRARRSTAVYNKKTPRRREQVSDDDFESDGFSDEPDDDDGDFSASEEEWLPGKDKEGKSDSAEGQGTVSDEDEDEESEGVSENEEGGSGSDESVVATGKSGAKKRTSKPSNNPWPKKKRLSPATRDELYKRTKKNLLREVDPELPSLHSSLSDILKQCQFQKKRDFSHCSKREPAKVAKKAKGDDESDSSGDDHLMKPEELDLSSKFFDKVDTTKQRHSEEAAPQFDCNARMRLSDSSEDDEQAEESIPASIQKVAAQQLINKINESSGEFLNFNNLGEFNKKIEEAKKMLKEYQAKESQADSENAAGEDVSNLLALGEAEAGTSPGGKADAGQQNEEASEESDWEEVEDAAKSQSQGTRQLPEDYHITVEVETAKTKKKRWEEIEMELYIKRQINKVKRANQLAFHKSSVLCTIAGGKKLNEIVNYEGMRGKALSLMQSSQCVLRGKIDEKFVEQLMKWFKGTFELTSEQTMGPKSAKFSFTLALELFTQKVVCKRDYVLLFLVCLRVAGVDCRLVISANVPPKRPAMKDLCPISERQLIEDFEKQYKRKMIVKSSPQQEDEETKLTIVKNEEIKTEDKPADETSLNEKSDEATEKPTRRTNKLSAKTSKSSKISGKSLPKIEVEDPVVEPRRTRTRANSAQKSTRNASADSSKKLRFSPEPEVLSGEPSGSPAKENARPRRPILKRASPRVANSPKREPLNSLIIPQLDGIDDLKSTPRSAPISRRLRSRVKSSTDPNGSSPFAKRKTNTPQAKEKNNNQPGRISKRKLFDVAKPLKEPTTAKPKSARNKILTSDSSDEEPHKSEPPSPALNKKRTTSRKPKPPHSSEDSDFESPGKKKAKRSKKVKSESPKAESKKIAGGKQSTKQKQTKKKVVEEEEGDGGVTTVSAATKMNFWIEFYSDKDKRWITVDLFTGKINCVDYLARHATSPISYVFGFDNRGHIKDVTPRYVQHWNNVSRMLRVEPKWLEKALKPFQAKKTAREKLEDEELNKIHIDKPLPTTIAECKNHPLYVLKRHLLKFEALYPADVPSLGFVRGEAIYARECLFVLQTREKWYKQGRVVKPFETAYKVVKCWRYDKLNNEWLGNQPCDIFGVWQTEEYDPPTAENGLVPRNEYGNVELFTPKMLPKKTVHLQRLNRVCRRLGIDCAPALTGFEKARMRMVPVYDGFVVCEEFATKVVEEWYKEMEEEDRREQEKFEKRVYGNWKRLIKGLLVRRKLQNKYNFDNL
ncbi:hypothetical protein RP20_CCG005379 [Aedes albopictus]|nr:hypothetical protein RP20_CCG005379 [Aedes albopictus]